MKESDSSDKVNNDKSKLESLESSKDLKPSEHVADFRSGRSLAKKLNFEWLDKIDIEKVDKKLLAITPYQFARTNLLLPLERVNGSVKIALVAENFSQSALDELRLIYNSDIQMFSSSKDILLDAINKAYDLHSHRASDVVDDINIKGDNLDEIVQRMPEDLLGASVQAPVIRLVNSILVEAVKDKASDIHIEPYENELLVRLRIDGSLRNLVKPPIKLMPLILSRIKVMAKLDIAEKRLPQDGRIKIVVAGKDIDIRVSTIPTSYGERIVMRMLDKTTMFLGFDQIGMKGELKDRYSKMIKSPHGIILVAGPTGSGKTTTLYATLSHIASPELNTLTVEDPVEYQLKGVGQMQVNSKIGLSFASGLRAMLRQDPDVIMVGEIRDFETAQIAVQASLTGHLVFSTIHTNDAAGSVTRLVDIGVEPFLIASSLIGSLAQRLVRRLCNFCKLPKKAEYSDLLRLGLEESEISFYKLDKIIDDANIYSPQGCELCQGSGYKGRIAIYELFLVDDEARSQIVRNVDSVSISQSSINRGLKPMRVEGAFTLFDGITSMDEIVRVTADI